MFNLLKRKSKPYTVELFLSADGWRWRLVHQNGEILSTSEAYSSKDKAEQTATNLANAGRFKYGEVIL